jgi:hypothetical protein
MAVLNKIPVYIKYHMKHTNCVDKIKGFLTVNGLKLINSMEQCPS